MALPETSWQAPVARGPLPVEFEVRAAVLVEEMKVLQAVLRRRREDIAKQLRAVGTVPRDVSQTSVYLDSVG
ncbi:hypothetical protein ACIPVK_07805 [Paeniglutamicibacter sp. MACA_103]|uniref:hypothetical protein n=1 Tax=Paeniglutamicibacter sp. MACA_103 TaxID=3377337 RepID=UPI0038940ACD